VMKNSTSQLNIPATDRSYVDALRALIRNGVMAAPGLENSPLVDLPVVVKRVGPGASPERRAHAFIEALREVIRTRLEGRDADIAAMLFGLGDFAGMPIQERYRMVAQSYNPYWTWDSYRKEPLTRQLLGVYLALKREAELRAEPSAEKSGAAVVTDTQTMPRARKVLIVKNVSNEGPGLLATLLEELALAYEVVDLSKGENFPDATEYAALVVLGGTDSANDTSEKMQTELARVSQALDAGVPYLGICLGLQVAVKASGGEVIPSVKEVGLSSPEGEPYSVSLTNLALTALGRKDPLFVGLRNDFRVFQLHGETVTTTGAMQLLATGEQVRNQIVKIRRNAYGIQSHFELTREMLQEWLGAHPDLENYNEEQVMAEFEQIEEVYTITGLSLLRNWLHLAGVVA
jgi:GMP synthase (glutamine-hydrolysing)